MQILESTMILTRNRIVYIFIEITGILKIEIEIKTEYNLHYMSFL